MPFKETDYSKLIPNELSERLKSNTNRDDEAKASELSGVNISTIRGVKFRQNNLTESNAAGVIALAQIASLKLEDLSEKTKADKRYFKNFLKDEKTLIG